MDLTMDDITRLAELMSGHELTELSLETADGKVKMKRGGPVQVSPALAAPAPVSETASAPSGSGDGAPAEESEALLIQSPIVGTFYIAPAPDAAPFVKVGDTVNPDTVVCIVEAMKVMNEIKAEVSGVIKRVLVENATPVEYGQPLFEVEPA